MACRAVMRSIIISSNTRRTYNRLTAFSSSSSIFSPLRSGVGVRVRVRVFNSSGPLRCSNGENTPRPPSPPQQERDHEVVSKAISVSNTVGRKAQTAGVDIGNTVMDAATNEWLELDQMVNSYPMVRGFTAIGTGGDDFVQAMVVAVESVIEQPIPKGQVTQKLSSMGKYVSVNIGPIRVISREQVQAVYSAMRRDDRMKYFW